jgi:c-di-AMP phosphodiesterase-like protein
MNKFWYILSTSITIIILIFIISAPTICTFLSHSAWWLGIYALYVFIAIVIMSLISKGTSSYYDEEDEELDNTEVGNENNN